MHCHADHILWLEPGASMICTTVFILIKAQYLIDTQAPAATNIPHLLKEQIHTNCLIKHQYR